MPPPGSATVSIQSWFLSKNTFLATIAKAKTYGYAVVASSRIKAHSVSLHSNKHCITHHVFSSISDVRKLN